MQTEQLIVTGMTCGGCSSKVTNALKAVDGVDDVIVSLATGEVRVQYDEKLASPKQLQSAVIEAGYALGTSNVTEPAQAKGGYG